ncbi:hypothetical protein H5410_027545 [Solanum commersonii]|uniref:Uncharacterized protein n=1 Tax=Solanum commersonii TaxID=4109 RepID=A0A9J5Z1J6_SOLCO|nr:hypothetical protein H5410_027545 [Solanum commersonii]
METDSWDVIGIWDRLNHWDLSAMLVGIADAFSDPPFDLLHLQLTLASLCPGQLYADCSFLLPICSFPSGLSTLEQKVNMRSIGDSPNGFGDLEIFISFSSIRMSQIVLYKIQS